ncbi:MAG: hypothetical protein K8H84_01005 [Sulfuricella denitrificans]|nr:hypothetical protein [Sulfuricella denitrificans]
MNKCHILSLAILSTSLATSATSIAYSLGDIQVQSYIGQPFRATIPIQTSKGEEIDSDCLKLSPPAADNNMIYLRRATLSLDIHGDGSHLLISGHFPLDEPYLSVVIDLACKEQGHLVREYTVLIDPPSYTSLPTFPSSTTENVQPASKIRTITHSEAVSTKPATVIKKKPRRAIKKAQPILISKNHQDQLKVLSGTGERPAHPGMSEIVRLQEHEKELMKELDDKTAKQLEMQAKLDKLDAKLAEMQKVLERQNQVLASMQKASVPEKKSFFSLKNDYWIAGPFILIVGFAYLLARRSRKRSLDDWKPTMSGISTIKDNIQPKKPR